MHLPVIALAAMLAGVAPIGERPPSLTTATRAGAPVGALTCTKTRRAVARVHVEVFRAGRTVIIPAGVGIAPPRTRDGAYVQGGRCRYPVWTTEPTGVVNVAHAGMRLRDLLAVWGQPATGGSVTVNGRPGTTDVRLTDRAQIVLQHGPPYVAPHSRYRFP